MFSSVANAGFFVFQGQIKKTLVSKDFSGCMIAMDRDIGSGCASSWVSLDCKGLFFDKSVESGKKKYASALVAAQTKKRVMLVIDNTQKANGYCVEDRIDVMF